MADTADASSIDAAAEDDVDSDEVEEEEAAEEEGTAAAAAAACEGLRDAIVAAAATANKPLGESTGCVGPVDPADEAELPASECACLCGKSAVRGLSRSMVEKRRLVTPPPPL